MSGQMRTASNSTTAPGAIQERLNSWKEIASFFEKDVRTVRRWEATRKLPVHRVPGGGRSGVFAYVSELQDWLADAGPDPGPDVSGPEPDQIANLSPENQPAEFEDPQLTYPFVERRAPRPAEPIPMPMPMPKPYRRYGFAASAVVLLAAVAVFALRQHRRAPAQSANNISSLASGKPSSKPEAQELYLRGVYLLNQRTEPGLVSAIDIFTQAIVYDPQFAAAYAGLSDSYILLRQYGRMSDGDAFPRALAAAREALALDDTSAEAHRAYAFLLNYWMWNFPEAEREFRRADELKPGDPQTHHWYATSLYSVSRFPEALEQIDIARWLQPDSSVIIVNRGLLLGAVDLNQGLDYLLGVEKVTPQSAAVHTFIAGFYARRGQYKPFLDESRTASSLRNDAASVAVFDQASAELTRNGGQAMMQHLGETFGARVDAGQSDAMQPAFYFIMLGDHKRCLHYMRLAGERHEANFLQMDQDPVYGVLVDEPEYRELLRLRRTPLSLKAALKINPALGTASR